MKFCGQCAAPLASVCSSCGAANPPGNKFCGQCAAPLTVGNHSEPRFASPEVYTPKHLAEKILTSKAALEGERKQVTVLFADLKGSMELMADRDPEEARKLLDPVLERMMEAVHRYEGTVNQIMGDGIMALFGAPVAHEDHAVRACYAALRMQESVKRYAEEVHRTAGVPLHIRVGVNSGDVVVRSIGSDLHMDYTAVGQTTHLAARLEQMAMPGSTLISPATLNLAEGYVVVKPLGERPVKGMDAPLEVFEVVGAGTVRSRLQAAATRGLTRFVGRDPELEQLRQALERAGAGHGQVVAVVGEPGVGKSRLFWEFTHSHRIDGWLLVESSSVSYGKATAFLPLIDLLRAYFQIEARDEARKIREKVTGKLLSLDRALELSLPALLWLLDAPADDPQWQRLDPSQRRQQTLDGIKRLLLRESQVQPLLLVFEDLHWIDAETQAFLDSMVESLPTARLLLLVNYRPEYQHAWGSRTYYRQLRIDPLLPEKAEQLLEALLGNDPGLQPLTRLLIERTEGNPFFLEESVRTLVETKVLAGERGAYRLARASHTLQIPATAQAILAARIDRLAPEEKRLLQTASVVGKDVPFALLRAIAAASDDDLRRGLAHLQRAEFLYETSLFPDLEYTFKHALTHEVAYGGLLTDRRRAIHARIVEAIETLYPERLTEQAERLAHHALRGEVWEKAVSYFRQAAARATARSAYHEAVAAFDQALAVVSRLPESHETSAQGIDLRLDLGDVLATLGQHQRLLDVLRQAEALATVLDDRRRLGWVSVWLCYTEMVGGNLDQAIAFAERGLAIAVAVGDSDLRIEATYRLGQIYYRVGDYARATDFLRRNADSVPSESVSQGVRQRMFPFMRVGRRTWLAMALAAVGNLVEAITCAEEGLQIAESDGRADRLLAALYTLGELHLAKGHFSGAIGVLERGLALARARDVVDYAPVVTGTLGCAYAFAARQDDALTLLQEAVRMEMLAEDRQLATLLFRRIGEGYLLAQRPTDALNYVQRGLNLARTYRERGSDAAALRLLGEIAAQREPPDVETADAFYQQALVLANELGMRPLVAHCHLGLGKLYRRTGDHGKAEEHLTTARAMYREMDMGFWLEKAETESGGAER